MIDKTNPPPPSGESFETGGWDESGVAPVWRRKKPHESFTKHIPAALVGGIVALVVSLLANSWSASRSEAFQYDQEQRGRIEAVRADINDLLNAIDERDDAAVELAEQRVEISSTFLPAYKSLLIPLMMAVMQKRSDLVTYEFLSIDPKTNERNVDESKLEKMNADGWQKISWEALRVRSKLLLSQDPFTLECDTELCDQLAL